MVAQHFGGIAVATLEDVDHLLVAHAEPLQTVSGIVAHIPVAVAQKFLQKIFCFLCRILFVRFDYSFYDVVGDIVQQIFFNKEYYVFQTSENFRNECVKTNAM